MKNKEESLKDNETPLQPADKAKIVLMHIPVGIGAMACFLIHWSVVVAMVLAFLTYEVVELIVSVIERLISNQSVRWALDRAYPEIAGMMIGLGMGAAVVWVLNYLGVDLHFVWKGWQP